MSEKNYIYIGIVNSGVSLSSQVFNLALYHPKSKSCIYVEFSDVDISILSKNIIDSVYSKQLLNNLSEYKAVKTHPENEINLKSTYIKQDKKNAILEIRDYLLEISDKGNEILDFICWHPTDWFYFLNQAFINYDEMPMVYEMINPNPTIITSILNLFEINYEKIINPEEFPEMETNALMQARYLEKIFKALNLEAL